LFRKPILIYIFASIKNMSKKNTLFAQIKQRLSAFRIFSYLRELSVVMIGVLATLAITNTITERGKQAEIREIFSLIDLELKKICRK
ncbi:MAG: hypothetical protein LUE93_15075, partial [Bacteroides sp.]|nr:hypothetical protein [Bacteroides sp.]